MTCIFKEIDDVACKDSIRDVKKKITGVGGLYFYPDTCKQGILFASLGFSGLDWHNLCQFIIKINETICL